MAKFDYKKIAKLVDLVKKDDSDAFAQLYSLTYQKVYFFVLSIVKDEFLAQDVVQEVYIKVLGSIKTLENNHLFVAWLNRIAYNAAIRTVSKQKDIPTEDEAFATVADTRADNDPLLSTLKNERQQTINEHIAKLAPPLKAVVILKYYQNLKIGEIAQIMDCPEGTVKSRLNTAKKYLQKALSKERSGSVMFGISFGLPIGSALTNAAKGVSMDSEFAFSALKAALEANGMSSNVAFKPAPSVPKPKVSIADKLIAIGAGGTAIGLMVTSLTPEFKDLDVSSEISANTIPISILMENTLPIQELYSVSPSGEQTPAKKQDNGYYLVEAAENGIYEIVAVGNNGVIRTVQVEINTIDKMPPFIQSYDQTDDLLILHVADNMAGVDFDSIYGQLSDGSRIAPVSVDYQNATVSFTFPKESFTVYMTDAVGNISSSDVSVIQEES